MRLSLILTAAFAATSVDGFAPNSMFGVVPPRTTTTCLQETHISKGFTADSGMTVDNIPLYIENLSVDNFEESLEMFEALLTNECVGDVCDDYVSQLKEKAASIGKELPQGFAGSHHWLNEMEERKRE